MPLPKEILLAVPPAEVRAAASVPGVQTAVMMHALSPDGHLTRSGSGNFPRGSCLYLSDGEFGGEGDPRAAAREIAAECARLGLSSVLCDWERPPCPFSRQLLLLLDGEVGKGLRRLCVPEPLAGGLPHARVLISSALSGGDYRTRLREARESFGGRCALAVERIREDFTLPAPAGHGASLSAPELAALLEAEAPALFFSRELCARYFTYRAPDGGAHFVLFEDAGTLRRKLQLAAAEGFDIAVLAYPQVRDLLPDLLRAESPFSP